MLDRETAVCRKWAACHREITRVYFFGSRVWGKPRPDSDLDIFVVAHPGAIGSNAEWTGELTRLLGVTVHLNDHFLAEPDLVSRIRSDGILVYSRHGDELDFQVEDELDEIDLGVE